MKKLTKILKLLIMNFVVLIVLLLVMQNGVYSSSFKFSLESSTTVLKPGDSVIVTMKIGDIVDVNNLGINTVEAVLEYDSNVFEIVTIDDMSGKNSWVITYNTQEKNFLVSNMISGIKEEQEIGYIKFKVKENISETKTVIKFKNIKSNDGKDLIPEEDRQIELTISQNDSNQSGSGTSIGKSSTKSGNGTSANTNSASKTSENKINDIALTQIPKAGKRESFIFVAILMGVVAIFTYARYNKIDK